MIGNSYWFFFFFGYFPFLSPSKILATYPTNRFAKIKKSNKKLIKIEKKTKEISLTSLFKSSLVVLNLEGFLG